MSNGEKLRRILFEHRLTQVQAARIICSITMRPCSLRAVRAWLTDPAKPSSRPCPDWVIEVMEQAVKEL